MKADGEAPQSVDGASTAARAEARCELAVLQEFTRVLQRITALVQVLLISADPHDIRSTFEPQCLTSVIYWGALSADCYDVSTC